MELNYYQLIFNNNKEYLVESNLDKNSFFQSVEPGLTKSNIFCLKLVDSESIRLFRSNLFSCQKVSKGIIGSQSKVWKLVNE